MAFNWSARSKHGGSKPALHTFIAFALNLERAKRNWNVPINDFEHLRQSRFREQPLSTTIPQQILDRLTDVEMPKLATERPPHEFISALGISLPVRRGQALVLGSGAAGLRAAVD